VQCILLEPLVPVVCKPVSAVLLCEAVDGSYRICHVDSFTPHSCLDTRVMRQVTKGTTTTQRDASLEQDSCSTEPLKCGLALENRHLNWVFGCMNGWETGESSIDEMDTSFGNPVQEK